MPAPPLSLYEREEISLALAEDRSTAWAQMGRSIHRHATTVMLEVMRHGGRNGYRPATAERRSDITRRRSRPRRLEFPGALRDRVIAELTLARSPLAIWADLVAEGNADRVCVETIYQAVYAGVLELLPTTCLRTRRPRRRGHQSRHKAARAGGRPNISSRPATVEDRSEVGHWEIDQVIGKGNRSSMLWLTERVTRKAIPVTMPEGYAGEAMLAGLICGLDSVPPHLLRSVTFDLGSEWSCWQSIASTYAIDVWFCDPHSPWQRGQVEAQNRQWRFWFPRGTDLSCVEQEYADDVAGIINGQRRRNLGYRSPTALYAEATVR